MLETTAEITQKLARRGRVRSVTPDAELPDVVRKMAPHVAAGLLHDGAGMDAQAIAELIGISQTDVRRQVAIARLDATDAQCDPCGTQLEGLMTFSADAVVHAMDCEECKATREALRIGKGILRSRWRAPEVEPVRPWDDRETVARKTAAALQAKAEAERDRNDTVVVPKVLRSRPLPVATASMTGLPSLGEVLEGGTTKGLDAVLTQPARTGSAAAAPSEPDDADRLRAGALAVRTEPTTTAVSATEPAPAVRPISLPDRAAAPLAAAPTPRARRLRPRAPKVRPGAPLTAMASVLLAVFLVAALSAASGGTAEEVGLAGEQATTPPTEAPRLPGHAEFPAVLPAMTQPSRAPRPVVMAEPDSPRRATIPQLGGTTLERTIVAAQPVVDDTQDVVAQDDAPAPEPSAPQQASVESAPEPPPTEPPPPTTPPSAAPAPTPEPTPEQVSAETWHRLAQCESNSNWAANTGNGFYGGLQFTLSSWQTVGGEGMPHEASPQEQMLRAQLLHDLQGWKAWPNCSRQLGLR